SPRRLRQCHDETPNEADRNRQERELDRDLGALEQRGDQPSNESRVEWHVSVRTARGASLSAPKGREGRILGKFAVDGNSKSILVVVVKALRRRVALQPFAVPLDIFLVARAVPQLA